VEEAVRAMNIISWVVKFIPDPPAKTKWTEVTHTEVLTQYLPSMVEQKKQHPKK
jgi:hypothetical protein